MFLFVKNCFVAETFQSEEKTAEEMMEESRWFCIFPSDYGSHLEMIGVSSEREDGDVITHISHPPTYPLSHRHTHTTNSSTGLKAADHAPPHPRTVTDTLQGLLMISNQRGKKKQISFFFINSNMLVFVLSGDSAASCCAVTHSRL